MQCATFCHLLHPLTTTRAPGFTLDSLQVGLREALLTETPKKKNLGVVALTDGDPRRDHRAVILGSSPFVSAAQGPRQAITPRQMMTRGESSYPRFRERATHMLDTGEGALGCSEARGEIEAAEQSFQ